MNIQINVYGSPWSTNAAGDAFSFINQVQGLHSIARVFFYYDGVYNGLESQSPASDEVDTLTRWQTVSEQGIELILCIAAATNRGILDSAEAKRYNKPSETMAKCFTLSGLGQWARGFRDCDRVINFK